MKMNNRLPRLSPGNSRRSIYLESQKKNRERRNILSEVPEIPEVPEIVPASIEFLGSGDFPGGFGNRNDLLTGVITSKESAWTLVMISVATTSSVISAEAAGIALEKVSLEINGFYYAEVWTATIPALTTGNLQITSRGNFQGGTQRFGQSYGVWCAQGLDVSTGITTRQTTANVTLPAVENGAAFGGFINEVSSTQKTVLGVNEDYFRSRNAGFSHSVIFGSILLEDQSAGIEARLALAGTNGVAIFFTVSTPTS